MRTLCDWFSSSASASNSVNLVFTRSKAERKRRSRKWNRSTQVSLDYKLYVSDYDSDSVARNQPLEFELGSYFHEDIS